VVLGICSALMAPAELKGKAWALDGDTLYVDHKAIRLWGVDAEELSEPDGFRARAALQDIVRDATVVCTIAGASHKRAVARCRVGGADVGEELVKAGAALDCPRYSGGHYRKAEPAGVRSQLMQKPYCRE
jgi:micrococcal nuclease